MPLPKDSTDASGLLGAVGLHCREGLRRNGKHDEPRLVAASNGYSTSIGMLQSLTVCSGLCARLESLGPVRALGRIGCIPAHHRRRVAHHSRSPLPHRFIALLQAFTASTLFCLVSMLFALVSGMSVLLRFVPLFPWSVSRTGSFRSASFHGQAYYYYCVACSIQCVTITGSLFRRSQWDPNRDSHDMQRH